MVAVTRRSAHRGGTNTRTSTLPAALAAFAVLSLPGCAGGSGVTAHAALPLEWRTVATSPDRTRLREWRATWTAAVRRVEAAGKGRELAAAGALFDPDRALAHAAPPAGAYRCRVFKLGGQRTSSLQYVAYPWFECRVSADERALANLDKVTGSQRFAGRLFADGETRAVFLGTMALGDERGTLPYGQDDARDMAGFVERIGEARWRLVLPAPAFESMLDVIEIIPASA